jgi:hypothetical protein
MRWRLSFAHICRKSDFRFKVFVLLAKSQKVFFCLFHHMYILLSARSGRPCRACSRRRLRKIFSAACPVFRLAIKAYDKPQCNAIGKFGILPFFMQFL